MFAKGTQGRADISRSLRQEVGEMVETHGPNFLSAPELERLRVVSSHGRRGTSQAAPAAAARLRAASPKGNTFSPGAKARLRSRPRTPERPPRLLVLCHRATSNRSLRHSGLDMRLGHLFRGVGGRRFWLPARLETSRIPRRRASLTRTLLGCVETEER